MQPSPDARRVRTHVEDRDGAGFCCWDCGVELPDLYVTVPDEDGDRMCLCLPCGFRRG